MLHVMVQSPEWLSRSDATDKAAILQFLAVTFTGLKMLVVIGTSVCISSQPIDVLVLRMDPHSHPSRSPISCSQFSFSFSRWKSNVNPAAKSRVSISSDFV